MPTFEPPAAECWVFTFKEGLLSAVAHDLSIRIQRFKVVVADGAESIQAEFDATSLRVHGARRDGRDAPELLSDSDKSKIESEIVAKVLDAKRFPKVSFASSRIEHQSEGAVRIQGILGLCGVEREIEVVARPSGPHWEARAEIRQPDWGIRPYTALFGALKIKPDVRILLRLPMDLGAS